MEWCCNENIENENLPFQLAILITHFVSLGDHYSPFIRFEKILQVFICFVIHKMAKFYREFINNNK